MCSIFRRFLKRRGLKYTYERSLILDTVLSKNGLFEADELVEDLAGAEARVSKATVYRTLKHLLESGIISEELIEPSRAHYRLAFGQQPQGHLVCLETHRVVEFPSRELDELMRKVCAEHGYDPVSHRFVIYGVSPEAAKAEGEKVADAED